MQAKIHSISRFQFFVAVCIFLLFFWLQIEEKNQKLESELERTKNELWTKEKMIVQLKEDAEEAAEKLKKVSTPSKQVSKGPDPRVVELEAKLKDARAELAMMRSGIEVKDKAFLEAQEQEKKVVDQLRAVNRALEERLREAIATSKVASSPGGVAGSPGGDKSLQAQLAAANNKIRDLQEGPLQVLEVSLASTKMSLGMAQEDVARLTKENSMLKEQSDKKVEQVQAVNRLVSEDGLFFCLCRG